MVAADRDALPDVATAVEAVYGLTARTGSLWIELPGRCLIQQGWKLHISTVVPDALTLVDRVLPALRRENLAAKVASSLDVLGGLNEGWYGPSQIGKFITVYPECGEQAVAMAVMLDGVTAGLRGPSVPSDRCLHSGSVVYYRYGSFVDRPLRLRLGEIVSAIATPDGSLEQDRRDTVYRAPAGVTDPFRTAGVTADLPPRPLVVAGRYVTAATLHRSARGAVYVAVDLQQNRRCVLKRASAHASARMDGQDAHDLLRHEFAMLERLRDCKAVSGADRAGRARRGHVPGHGGRARAVAGRSRCRVARRRSAPSMSPAGAAELAEAWNQLHQRHIVHGDLKPANISVTDHR